MNAIEAKDKRHRAILQNIAQRTMLEQNLVPDFSGDVVERDFIDFKKAGPSGH